MSSRNILFAGGGTSGHTAKLLAVMAAVLEMDPTAHCSYVGLRSDLHSPLIVESSLSFKKYAISSGKLNRYLTLKHVVEIAKVAKGFKEARTLLKELRPDVIFTNGGFVTVPVAIAAGRLGIPIVTHETDVVPGLSNKIIARFAKLICTTYPTSSYKNIPQAKLRQTGQPVRAEFYADTHEPLVIDGREVPIGPLILVTGGSQGARRLNQLVGGAWEALLSKACIIHLTGSLDAADYFAMREGLPTELRERLWVAPFLTAEFATAMRYSTLVISRAGGTIAELAATRRPSVLLPLSTAAQDHQRANARVLEEVKAAIVFDEAAGTSEMLARVVLDALASEECRSTLSTEIARFDHPNAAKDLAKILLFE
jgi:UDP-N-acetylglucosamine--N-acetylmuramyl-(pentapeptide) pyrophosphoryl-undecaprenol N-acetylglucosamine transferase